MRNVVSGYDLDRVDGRLAALRASAPLVSSVRDASLEMCIRDSCTVHGWELVAP